MKERTTLILSDFQGERSGVAGKTKDASPESEVVDVHTDTLVLSDHWLITGRSFTPPLVLTFSLPENPLIFKGIL